MNNFNNKRNFIIRVLFFLGVILVTIFSILMEILDLSSKEYIDVKRWAVIGFLIGAIFVILSFSVYFRILRFLKNDNPKKENLHIIFSGITVSIICATIANLIISIIYGDAISQDLVTNNPQLLIFLSW